MKCLICNVYCVWVFPLSVVIKLFSGLRNIFGRLFSGFPIGPLPQALLDWEGFSFVCGKLVQIFKKK